MNGILWAVAAGVGFGVFQSVNRRAVRDMDPYTATFIQLLIGFLVLAVASLATQDLSLLRKASIWAWIYFGLAGFIHFFVGWTCLNASQKLIGAARTSSLIGTTPLFGTLFAAITLAEIPTLFALGGILFIVSGVYLVNYARLHSTVPAGIIAHPAPGLAANPAVEGQATGWRSLWVGLTAAICWSLSPTFIRKGLLEMPSPIIGVTIGIGIGVIGYAGLLLVRSRYTPIGPLTGQALTFKLIAALLAGLAVWAHWTALELVPVAVVLGLSLLSVPVVNLVSPLLVGRNLEQVTAQVWLGSGLIAVGSLILIWLP